MMHSRDLKYLRPDVRVNCEAFLQLCKDAGLNVLVTETVRDEEYQRDLVKKGYASKNATKPTFHSVKAGLAFDICKNVRGHEYDDPTFFMKCGQIGKQVGFSWGGDWKSFVDRPHFQWDAHKKWTGSMILAGKLPPEMDEYMDQSTFNKMMDNYLAQRSTKPVSSVFQNAWNKAKQNKILDGSSPNGFLTREQFAIVLERLGLIK